MVDMINSIPEWAWFVGLALFFGKFIWNLKERQIDRGHEYDPHESTGTSGWGEGG